MNDNMMEFNIDQELEEIIEKYNLDRYYPAYRTSGRACAYLKEWVESLSEMNTKILFITMNDSVLWMIRRWAVRENISAIQITSVENLDNHITALKNADKVYIAAYTRTVEILHWLWRHDFHAESVYDILENQNIYCQMEFYRFFSPLNMSDELKLNAQHKEVNTDGSALTLYEYYYQKQRLLYAVSEEDKRRINEKLFFLAIYMRNFLEAEKILRAMPHNVEYKKCWQEIEKLLDKIKRILAQKEQNHIIIYWLDALNYEYVEKLEYLHEQRNHSLYFHNAFTPTPFTFPTFKSMFLGIRQVDDLGYQIKSAAWGDSPLIQDIREQGYDFKLISNFLNRYFEQEYNFDYYGQQICNAPCSEVFWNLTKQIIQSGQPAVFLTHALVEIHGPRLGVRRDRFEQEYDMWPETIQDQCDELSDQLRFYDQMMGDRPYRIYMSDHASNGTFIDKVHVCFQIYHATWRNKEVNKLFCYLDFHKIIHQLLIGEEIDDTVWDREYVPIQDVDYYNSNVLKEYLVRTELYGLPFYTAYKGVVTKEYVYAHFKTGDEIFHKWSDGAYLLNVGFDNSRTDTRLLKELRKKAGDFPKELDTDPKFSYAKNTYIVYGNVKRTVQEAAKLLNEKISGGGYSDGSIVLKPGGVHTMRIYMILSEDSRRKIGGILDRNAECKCKDLGYPIYQPEDKLPDNIKAILLSTYENLEELRCETQKIYSALEVMDIYQYWKECGYAFSKNFWYGLESDRDIEFLKE